MEALGGVEAPDFVNLNWLLLIQVRSPCRAPTLKP